MKLLLIPVFFILLRMWSLLQSIIQIEAGKSLTCTALLFFVHIGVSFLLLSMTRLLVQCIMLNRHSYRAFPLSLSLSPHLPQGIGDSGQGFANAILFALFTPKVRRYFLHQVFCLCLCRRAKIRGPINNRGNSNVYYRAVQSPNREHSRTDDDSHSKNTKINVLLDHSI